MPVLRVLLAVFGFALAQPALAVEFWDPAECRLYLEDDVRNLEDDVADIEDLLARIAEAERKGDGAAATNFRTILQSKRVDGIQGMLKRVDTVEYVYCDKSLFDPELIARVDAARPYAEETAVPVAATEEVPKIALTGIGSTFVPYEMLEGGGCKGPFLDLTINIANLGGSYPRKVDVDRRLREYPNENIFGKPLLSVTLLIDWGYGGGYGQEVIPLAWDAFENGAFASGAAKTLPYRLFIPNDKTSVKLGGWVTGASFFVVDGESYQSATYETEASFSMWDIYTESVGVVSLPSRDNKNVIEAAIMATIVNRGNQDLPGPVAGNFTVKQNNTWIGTFSGKSLAASQPILAGTTVRAMIKGKTFVDSGIQLLCPDGSAGTLSDGNSANNVRTLESQN